MSNYQTSLRIHHWRFSGSIRQDEEKVNTQVGSHLIKKKKTLLIGKTVTAERGAWLKTRMFMSTVYSE